MKTRRGFILKGLLAIGSLAIVSTGCALAFLTKAIPPATSPIKPAGQQATLSVFAAPSSVPAGQNWVIVGSFSDLPEDLAASPASAGVTVLETQRISNHAIGVKVDVALGVSGKLLHVASVSQGSAAEPDLYLGASPDSRTADANFTEASFQDGQLVVDGDVFFYAYLPRNGSVLSATRIHNRRTGTWTCYEHALERARVQNEPPIALGANFVEVDVFETLPDTDGDGVADFADDPEPVVQRPEQLGVAVLPGVNLLDLVAVDEAGVASWRTIQVYSTAPAE